MEEEEYYSDDEGVHKPAPIVNEDELLEWVLMMEERIKPHLQAFTEQKAFDNYEVHWEDELQDITEKHLLLTDFNFI